MNNKNYNDKISTWKKNIPEIKKHDNDLKWIGIHHKKIYDYIKNTYHNLNSLKSHISILSGILKFLNIHPRYKKKYSLESTELSKKVQYISNNQELSQSRKQNYISFDDIVKKRDELKNLFFINPTHNKYNLMYLILCLYTYQPPIRQEYKDMKIIKIIPKNKLKNYLLNNNGKYSVIIKYDKVIRSHGPINFELSETLNNIINESLLAFPRTYILSNLQNGNMPMTKSSFENLLYSCFDNKKIGVDILRSAYITHKYNDKNFNINMKNDLAKQMRHSYMVADSQYNKIINSDVRSSYDESMPSTPSLVPQSIIPPAIVSSPIISKPIKKLFDVKEWGKLYRQKNKK